MRHSLLLLTVVSIHPQAARAQSPASRFGFWRGASASEPVHRGRGKPKGDGITTLTNRQLFLPDPALKPHRVARGQSGLDSGSGAIAGALIGVMGGLALVQALSKNCHRHYYEGLSIGGPTVHCSPGEPSASALALGGLLGAAAGAMTGALIGAAVDQLSLKSLFARLDTVAWHGGLAAAHRSVF